MLLLTPGSGFLAYGSSYSLHLPSRTTSGFSQVSSPFTVAGQRRTYTGFPRLQDVQATSCPWCGPWYRGLCSIAELRSVCRTDRQNRTARRCSHPARAYYSMLSPCAIQLSRLGGSTPERYTCVRRHGQSEGDLHHADYPSALLEPGGGVFAASAASGSGPGTFVLCPHH